MRGNSLSQVQLGLFDTPPNRKELRLGFAIVGVVIVALVCVLPFRDIRLNEVTAFVPVVDAMMLLGELITATLLYAQSIIFRSRALAVLASGYVFTAFLLVPHALSFPGAFAPDGLLGAGLNSTAWIAFARRFGFPVAVALYALLKPLDSTYNLDRTQRRSRPGPLQRWVLLPSLPSSQLWDTVCSLHIMSIGRISFTARP